MNAAKMAELFDGIDVDRNLESVDSVATSFEDHIEDIKSVMSPAPLPPSNQVADESEMIKSCIAEQKSLISPEGEDDLEVVVDERISGEVNTDIAEFEAAANSPTKVTSLSLKELPHIGKSSSTNDNPLSLSDKDLAVYQQILDKYPQFRLYDGSLAFKDFYVWKLYCLKNLLSRFPVLNVKDLSAELRSIKTDHFLGDDYIDPDIIRVKMDNVQKHKTRLASLMIDVLEQYYLWERHLDMLRAKLWKDHDIKGVHKRDGILLEHIGDMECYLGEMKGFVEAAKQYESLLRSAAESLSRQLSCLQFKEQIGLVPNVRSEQHKLDKCDSVSVGTVISAPKISSRSALKAFADSRSDDISVLG